MPSQDNHAPVGHDAIAAVRSGPSRAGSYITLILGRWTVWALFCGVGAVTGLMTAAVGPLVTHGDTLITHRGDEVLYIPVFALLEGSFALVHTPVMLKLRKLSTPQIIAVSTLLAFLPVALISPIINLMEAANWGEAPESHYVESAASFFALPFFTAALFHGVAYARAIRRKRSVPAAQ